MHKTKFILILLVSGIIIGVLIWRFNSIEKKSYQTSFYEEPEFLKFINITPPDTSSRIFSITQFEDKFFVSFLKSDCIYELDASFTLVRKINLLSGESASITNVVVTDEKIYAVNFKTGELHVADYQSGRLLKSFGFFPDQKTRMKLFGAAYRNDIIYLTETLTNTVIAISLVDVEGLKQEGELLLQFPGKATEDFKLNFPTFLAITQDGRLLVSDVGNRQVKAFSCSGRPGHFFDQTDSAKFVVPMGIAFDDVPSPELLAIADSIFDPSGVYHQGRIHIVDAELARVKVFNSLGKYVLTYGKELQQPNGIAIDQNSRRIYISDSRLNSIAEYRY